MWMRSGYPAADAQAIPIVIRCGSFLVLICNAYVGGVGLPYSKARYRDFDKLLSSGIIELSRPSSSLTAEERLDRFEELLERLIASQKVAAVDITALTNQLAERLTPIMRGVLEQTVKDTILPAIAELIQQLVPAHPVAVAAFEPPRSSSVISTSDAVRSSPRSLTALKRAADDISAEGTLVQSEAKRPRLTTSLTYAIASNQHVHIPVAVPPSTDNAPLYSGDTTTSTLEPQAASSYYSDADTMSIDHLPAALAPVIDDMSTLEQIPLPMVRSRDLRSTRRGKAISTPFSASITVVPTPSSTDQSIGTSVIHRL